MTAINNDLDLLFMAALRLKAVVMVLKPKDSKVAIVSVHSNNRYDRFVGLVTKLTRTYSKIILLLKLTMFLISALAG